MNRVLRALMVSVVLAIAAQPARAAIEPGERLLAGDVEPDGVVFELVSGDDDAWDWALPAITEARKRLLARWPSLDIVVVSHGAEQFELTGERLRDEPDRAQGIQSMVGDGVTLHVCGTHSSWRAVPDSAYASFVDVTPSGPAKINDYRNLGYTLIRLQPPDGD